LLYGLSLDELAAFNHMSPDAILQVGQELWIRQPTATPAPTPAPTGTATPEVVQLAAADTPTPTRPEPTAIAMVTEPETSDEGGNWNSLLAYGALAVGVALTILAGVAVLILWRDDK